MTTSIKLYHACEVQILLFIVVVMLDCQLGIVVNDRWSVVLFSQCYFCNLIKADIYTAFSFSCFILQIFCSALCETFKQHHFRSGFVIKVIIDVLYCLNILCLTTICNNINNVSHPSAVWLKKLHESPPIHWSKSWSPVYNKTCFLQL